MEYPVFSFVFTLIAWIFPADDGTQGQEPTDSLLIVNAKKGDTSAYDLLVRRYQKRVYALILRMTRDLDPTDDLAQEAFVKAYFALSRFKEGHDFYPWICRIAMNLTLNYLAKQRRRAPEEEIEDRETVRAEEGNPLRSLESAELRGKVESAIAALPLDQKSVFLLRVTEGFSYEEISRVLSIPKGTVMSRLNRARERLKKMLQHYLETK